MFPPCPSTAGARRRAVAANGHRVLGPTRPPLSRARQPGPGQVRHGREPWNRMLRVRIVLPPYSFRQQVAGDYCLGTGSHFSPACSGDTADCAARHTRSVGSLGFAGSVDGILPGHPRHDVFDY